VASLQPVNSDSEEKDEKGRASRAAKSSYQPRKATSLASRPITFKAQNFISEAEKIQLQDKIHTPWELAARAAPGKWQIAYLPVILVSVMVCFAAYLLFRSQNLGVPVAASPYPAAAVIDAPDYEERMIAALKDFCESGDVSRIKGVIRHADHLGVIVENYYRGSNPPQNKIIKARVSSGSMFLSPLEASLFKAVVTFEGGQQRDLILEWIGGEAKVDWECWVRYNPVPVADFLDPASQVGAEQEFRLMGRLPAQYRTSNRFPEIRYNCVVFQDKAHDGIDFEAYVLRGTETNDQVMAYLAGNAAKPLIVKLHRHNDKTKAGAGIEITGMVTKGWVRAMPSASSAPRED
jgi:hypothetical protein